MTNKDNAIVKKELLSAKFRKVVYPLTGQEWYFHVRKYKVPIYMVTNATNNVGGL